MRALRFTAMFIAVALLALTSSSVNATSVLQMNLAQMINNSEKVFVGTVVDLSESRIAVGGGEVPAVTYTFRVGDTFKGSYEEEKGVKFTTVTMLGTIKNVKEGKHPIVDFPFLRCGEEYLLVVGHAGSTGLTTTVGLGQGNFTLSGEDGDKVALNAASNVGLFTGMSVGFTDGVAVPYPELAALIRDIVGGAE